MSSSETTRLLRLRRAGLLVLALFPLLFLVAQRIARGSSSTQAEAEFKSEIALSEQLLRGKSARESLVPLSARGG